MSDPLRQGPYRLVRRLAVGGMGEVLLAETDGEPRVGLGEGLVVIKRTLPKHPNQDHHNQMLREEGRIALRLRHANLVETFALDQIEDTPLLIMEYLAGRSMAQVLGAAKRTKELLPVDVALKIIHEAACGLHFAHTLKEGDRLAGLVHRDVSPANIFVTFDGRVKVIDFGVAKADDSEIKTSTGVLKGKIGYMSPEHTLGEKLDPRSDLWSLGVLLWESLIAERLFASQNPALTLHKINNAEIVRPSVRRPDIPASVDALVMRLLTRDKGDRVASGAELVRLIDNITDVDWRTADLGGFLMTRFPDEAARGQKEASQSAKAVGAPPVPQGLVSGHADAEGGIDEEAATIVANSRDLIELARRVSADDAIEEDEARTVQMSAAEVAALTGALSAPPAGSDDDGARGRTEPQFGGKRVLGERAAPPQRQADASLLDDLEAATLLRTPEEMGMSLTQEDDPLGGEAAGDFKELPEQSSASGSGAASAGQVTEPPAASSSPSSSASSSASSNASSNPSSPPSPSASSSRARRAARRRGPSATAVALGTFGVLATAMGLAFGMLQPAREPLVVAWTADDGAERMAARIDVPPTADGTLRKVDLQKPWMVKKQGGGAVFLDRAAFNRELQASGVWARADLPHTLRARFSAALPPLFIVLGLLALAWALPAFVLRGAGAWAVRVALIVGALALGSAGLVRGLLGWPGLSRLNTPAAVLEPADLPPAKNPQG